jgi:hypothetical protein
MSVKSLKVEIAPGELIDKITILEIKSERMDDPAKLENVRRELEILSATRDTKLTASGGLDELAAKLKNVNEKLWVIEDDIRDCEAAGDFGETFIGLARAVYQTNDERARLKREINVLLGSEIIEEKSYKPY